MLVDMLKGFLVGVCASAPVGPIAILVVQKSLSKGHKAGFVSGLGASVVDTIYAIIAIFALAFAQKFIDAHQNLILFIGGAVLGIVGLTMALSDPFRKMKADGSSSVSPKDFGQAVAMGLSNPMAIFVMFTLYAFFGLADDAPLELERLNMFPDHHTAIEGVDAGKRAFLMGNALVTGIVTKIGLELKNRL